MKLFMLRDIPGESDQSIILDGEDFHYLCRVKRLALGTTISARDKAGMNYDLKMTAMDKGTCTFEIMERNALPVKEQRKIYLFQAMPKGNKMDLIVRQATEAGVSAVIPLESDHSLVKLKTAKDRSAKKERWSRVVKEALQQSGSSVLTSVEETRPFTTLADFIQQGGTGFFCHQEERRSESILKILPSLKPQAPLGLVIGPEGGLSVKEVDNLEKWGYHSLYFGDNVLRAETASLYAVAAVKTVLRELYL